MITSDDIQEMAAYSGWQNDNLFECHDDIGAAPRPHHRSHHISPLHALKVGYRATDIPWRHGAGFFAG
jgi:hypothetical protein